MRALSSRPFCPCDSRRVSLRYLSAVGRYTARQVDGHDVRAGHVKNRRAAELPESTAFAETYNCRIDHSLYKLSEGGTLRHMARRGRARLH